MSAHIEESGKLMPSHWQRFGDHIKQSTARHILTLVIVLALLARIALAVYLGDTAAPISGAADQYSYDVLAQRILLGKGYSFPSRWYPFTLPDEPTAHWSFLYPLYLSSIYALIGHHPLAARLVQILLSGFNIWLAYRIGQKLFGTAVGLAAAALTAAYAYFIFFNAVLMTQTFYIMALLSAILLSLSVVENPSTRRWIILGIALGAGIVLRQTLLLYTPLLLAWITWTLGRRIHWRGLLATLAIIAIFILPWTLRNYVAYHDFLLLNSNGGYWFYAANHPSQGTNFDPNYVAPLPADMLGLSEPALDRALYRRALDIIIADPARFLMLSVDRMKDYFWFMPSPEASLPSNLSRLFSFTLYLPVMLYGLFLSFRNWRACLPVYAYVVFDAVLHLSSWAAPRYRLPSDALMMVFAGLAILNFAERLGLLSRLRHRLHWLTELPAAPAH